MKRLSLLLALALLLAACASGRGGGNPMAAETPKPAAVASSEGPLAALLARPAIAAALRNAPEQRIQIVLGLIEEDASGRSKLSQISFRAGAEYFYPASAVKLFAAVAALEKLHDLEQQTGLAIGPDTPLVYHPLFAGEQLEKSDASNLEGGAITVRHELRKIFLVSDNEAFNKLYEIVGQDGLDASLDRAGLDGARLVHRLDEFRSPEENRRSPRIDFAGEGFVHTLPERLAAEMAPPPAIAGILVGKGYLAGGRKVRQPMDFSGKNRFPLEQMQRGLCKVLRPEVDCGAGGSFQLDEEDRAMLRGVMAQYPRESKNPVYSAADYSDTSGKFLLPGLLRAGIRQEDLRIANKFGQAYGFSTENALVTNAATGKSIFFAATIYTNADGILNDDQYDYEKVARPFFAALGEGLAELLK